LGARRQLDLARDQLDDAVQEVVLVRDVVVERHRLDPELLAEPPHAVDWKEGLRQTAISSHEVFLRHRWACSLMMRPRASPARMRWMEAVLRTLRQAGFSADMTHHAYHALDSHITGFTLWLVSMPFASKEELVDMAEGFLREIPPAEYPYVIEHAEQHVAPSSPDGQTEFEFGLELILDGLERLRDPA